MRLERFNVVREVEDEREIEYFKSIGFEEVEAEAEETKPRGRKKATKE